MIEKELETKVEEVLRSDTVSKAKRLLGSRSGTTMVATISFIESAFPLPILTDPFLVAAILVKRENVAKLIFVTTIASAAGGVFAYFTAMLFFDLLLRFMTPDMVEQFQSMIVSNKSSTLVLTLVGAITPVPYTVVAWVVGVLKGGLVTFIMASIFGRGLRYLIVGYSAYYFGPLAISYAKRFIGIISASVIGLAVLFFWLNM